MTQAPSQWTNPRPETAWPEQPRYGHPSSPGGVGAPRPPGFGGPTPPRAGGNGADRPRPRPGWAALVLATAASAVLASGLTLGAVRVFEPAAPAASISAPASSGTQATPPVASDGTLDWTKVASAVSPSVVSIMVSGNGVSGSGSGVVLDTDGHILTNNHVASAGGSGETLQVGLSDGRVFDNIKVIGLDPATDLAVLQIVNPPKDLVPATLGDSSKVVAGQPVMAVGNPLGLNDTVTTGIVSAVDRPVSTSVSDQPQQADPFGQNPFGQQQQQQQSSPDVVTNAIQTDAAVNPGNSGGALVDVSGSVIGIPSSIASMSSGSSGAGSIGLGFAIPSNEAKRIADELISTGKASHAWLGVSLTDGSGTADGATRNGAQLAQIVPGTPAAEAGLQQGEIVVKVDGETVTSAESLTAQIRERAPGDKVTLSVIRGGAVQDVSVTLATKGD